ncbi:phospho-sugar mutase [Microbacterium sp. LRZ72]|uniref:phospho-sugar mutase n=1 Tax=Microbacterium sp. LRZ72 TaxID=2942481 RepID=UPI0029BBB140|nr:phospho-sugar mutase [Microbacterium sp. LRZ72]MDX2376991.1 phospho-sugar mutase [Microbacterium sp. LRZ72]
MTTPDAAGPSGAIEAARAWLAQDPDTETRAELQSLITAAEGGDAAASADLVDRFGSRLAFGTAGLRGALGAGSNRMNRVLVAQAAAGFAAYLRERPEAAEQPSVVIGYDARKNSHVFARDSAEIFAGAGLRAILLPQMLPTPVLAFAVRHLAADAGVMVTASHNPPEDNGYKVYLGGADEGTQIVAPADAAIAAQIDHVARTQRVDALPRSEDYEVAPQSVLDAYVAASAAVAPAPSAADALRWVYTPLHGVGWHTLERVLDAAGYPHPTLVDEQAAPDGSFPTVAFPNPEEPGAMDLAFATARRAGAQFVLANDPDADRLAVAIPDSGHAADGGWRRLTGNEVGLLLGWWAARRARSAGAGEGATLACSLVSSPGLEAVAHRYGLVFRETLTGFKWISRAPGIVYGFEEALGYLVDPGSVRDKDGVSAAVAVLAIAADAHARGSTLRDELERFGDEFGHYASTQVSVRVTDLGIIAQTMARLRSAPPAAWGGVAVAQADDLLHPTDGGASGDVLRYRLEDGSRVIVRPSGTEPKLKVYIDARGDTAADAAARVVRLEDAARALVA